MDLLLAFPILLFSLTLTPILQAAWPAFLGSTLPIVSLIIILGFFGWPCARIVRGQVLSLRGRIRRVGARNRSSSGRIIMKEIIPNVTAIAGLRHLGYPTNITAEAALSSSASGSVTRRRLGPDAQPVPTATGTSWIRSSSCPASRCCSR
jgi:peptide/nickel transport system permease protein